MKRSPLPAALTALLLASFFFSACIKEREYIEQHSSDIGKYCKIDSMAVNEEYVGWQYFKFSYDAAGNPVEMRLQNPDAEGLGTDLHFRYDKKGRLSDVLDTDPGQTFVYTWSRYTYVSPRVIVDSFFEYQDELSDPNPDPGSYSRLTKMFLDDEGRPVRFISLLNVPNVPADTSQVSYDMNGNLVVPGFKYDDKINIYQTSPTWQLLFANYSRNNLTAGNGMTFSPITPATYNAYGLPTKYLPYYAPITVFGFSFGELDVTYSCDVPASPSSN